MLPEMMSLPESKLVLVLLVLLVLLLRDHSQSSGLVRLAQQVWMRDLSVLAVCGRAPVVAT